MSVRLGGDQGSLQYVIRFDTRIGDGKMIDQSLLEKVVIRSAKVAALFLGIGITYSVRVINDSSLIQDGLFGADGNEICINIARLEPYPQSALPLRSKSPTEEEKKSNEDIRYALRATYIVFHEMRHLYQKRAVEAYAINRMLGGGRSIPPLENDKKCALWEQELKEYKLGSAENTDIEADAETFATYLIHRYPVKIEMKQSSRRMGAMKRKYDRKEIPQIDGDLQ